MLVDLIWFLCEYNPERTILLTDWCEKAIVNYLLVWNIHVSVDLSILWSFLSNPHRKLVDDFVYSKSPSKASFSPELQKPSLWGNTVHSLLLACFSLQDSKVESCSKKWRKERAGAEIEQFLSKIARAWIVLFSRPSHYLRPWHRLPRKHSFTTY